LKFMAAGRVAVAMSGGVDSSVAAAILKEQGYDVLGVTMRLRPDDSGSDDAEKVAAKLGIPHHVMDFRRQFEDCVIAEFCSGYAKGLTPNPCIVCNRQIKFGLLWQKAAGLGADFIATGHYARVQKTGDGFQLLKGIDTAKDQSYFLYTLTQEQLGHLLLPVGDMTKQEVRQKAAELGLPSAEREESQDICFIDGDYRDFLAGRMSFEPGDIVDKNGRALGRHGGLPLYTIGQRQGLGLASEKRLYVTKLDTAANRLVVGAEDDLYTNRLTASDLNWISGKTPKGSGITAKIRYRAEEVPLTLEIENSTAGVTFKEPQRAVAPGQAVVFYRRGVVLGGGTIIIDK
jgi:tRNA-specific 2-thiouridylase